MRLVRHAHECGKFFTLSACRKDNNAVRRVFVDVLGRDDRIRLYLEHAGERTDLNVCLHRASFNNDFLIVFLSDLDDIEVPFAPV